MLRSLRFVTLSLAAAAALSTGCRDTGGDDQPGNDGGIDAPQGSLTIQDVQSDTMVPGTPVDLRGKVVTAIDTFGNRKGNFFIGEEGGGEYSGVLVFGAPLDQVALLAVGDKVDISGAEKTEFAIETDTSGRTTTELQPVSGGTMTVTKVGTGTVPTPHVVDALAIGQMDATARDAEFEKWEGVLISVENVSVTRGIRQISGSTPDPTFREFDVTGVYHVDSSLAAIPAVADGNGAVDLVAADDCLASVTGIGDYFFSYKILPRMTADIMTGGTACPAPEEGMTACSDGVDNDANGFADCTDRSCQTLAMCTTDTTVADIQTGVVPDGAVVNLADVVVTGISFTKKNLWIADHAAAAVNEGIYVFRGGSSVADLPANIVVGAHISVNGTVDEFGNGQGSVTEITFPTLAVLPNSPIDVVTPLTGIAITTLVDRVAGEPYEGVLVQLPNVKVAGPLESTAVPPAFPTNQRPLLSGTTMFKADDDMYRMMTEVTNDCYLSMTGIWHYNTFSDTDNWVFLPRSAADLVPGGSCP